MLTIMQPSFAAGEISPSLFGRIDLAKWHQGASTMRNFFVNYRGGAASRAGTKYVGICKQPGTAYPPRDIKFQFNINQGYALEFGDQYMRIKSNGAYVIESPITVVSVSSSGLFTTSGSHGYSNGDSVFDQGNVGFNGLNWIINSTPSGTTFTVTDLFGNPITSATPSTGGTVARIYTVVAPYAAVDLPYLKYTQSADTMTLTCVNTSTLTEYPSYELVRHAATNWTFTADSFASSIAAPTNVTATATSSTTVNTWYSYVVTAVDALTGEESVASSAVNIENNDISINAGSNTVTWSAVTGASSYNIYKATPSYSVSVPIGVLYGFAGTSLGPSFTDTNITADFTQVPPTHQDPFARGQITDIVPIAQGSGYTQATIGYTLTTSTGTGFAGTPIVVGGKFVAFLIANSGKNFAIGDTITITDSGSGTGATATLTIGPETGTYPSTCAYYQQRRVYASSLNQPDTYWMSQPGAFNNMDSSIPTTDSDAIVGAPWAQQVNGVQFLVPMPGGLVVLTGNGAWQLNGGNSAAITPADQTANPQAYNGCNNIVAPITINYDILYVQAKGSIVRDLSYNFFVNIYTGTDMTVLSNQLFNDKTILQWAWSEEPYKLVWCIRNDGIMLSLTYLKEQDIYAWARHDTNGLYSGVVSITEPPVDAVYLIVKRYVQGAWRWYSERMDDRSWENVEDSWCVDCGLSYPMTFPSATLTPVAATGNNNITGTIQTQGGSGYTSPTVRAIDPTGSGSGAIFTTTVVSGVLTAITPLSSGQKYQPGTQLQISDPTGTGAIFQPVITNFVAFNTDASVFSPSNVGNIIRVGGGKATVVTYTSGTSVIADITQPITETVPDDPNATPIPATSGNWSIAIPTMSVSGLNHLEGLTVAILADGSVAPNQVVTNGEVSLQAPYSAITVGLPFLPQLQGMYLDPPGPDTSQSKRKNIYAVSVRMESSRGLSVGANQPDASTQPNGATVTWTNMTPFKERNATIAAGTAIPLFTGDEYTQITSDWNEYGQVAVQQSYPLPANVLGWIAYYQLGDTSA